MGLRFKILITILSIVLLYAFYYFAIPKFINIVHNDIISFIQKEYGISIKIKNPKIKMSLTPAIWLKADEFNVLNPDNTNVLYIKSPVLKISILPLIIKKAEIKYFKGKNLIANIYYDKDFVIYLGKYRILKDAQKRFNFNDTKFYLDNYKINCKNISNNKTLTLDGMYFNIDKYKKNKFLKISLYSKLISNKTQSNINLNIETKLPFNQHLDDYPPKLVSSVTNLNLEDISDFIKFYTKGKISKISGVINYEGHSANTFEGQKEYSSYFMIDKPYISSNYLVNDYIFENKIRIYYNLLLSKNTLSIPDIAVKTDKVSLKISGLINDISSGNPKPDINVSMYQTKLENVLEILPCLKLTDKDISISQMKKLNLKSDLNLNINVKNTLEKPYLYGYLNMSNTGLKNKKDISDINFKFDEENLNISSQTILSKKEKITLNGKMKIRTPHNAEFETKSINQVDLGEAENYLVILHNIFNFKISPIEFINTKGKGNFDLKVNGSKTNFNINGNIEGKNLTMYLNNIKDAYLSNANFNLSFKNKESYFKIENAKLKNNPVYIIGKYNLGKDFEIKADLKKQNLNYLFGLYKNNFNKQIQTKHLTKLNGNADIKLDIKFLNLENIKQIQLGNNLELNALAHLYNTDLYFKNYKVSNISGDMNLKNYNAKINLNTQIANSNIKLNGNINKDIANIDFDISKISLFDFLSYIKPSQITVLKSSNDYSYIKLAGNYKGSIKHINPQNINMNGHIFLKNFNFIYNKNKLPVNIISGYTYLNEKSLYLNKLNMQVANMPVIFDGSVNNLFKQPYIEAYISSKPKQRFVDFIYNKNSIYPIKLKGDMSCTSFISGEINKNIKMNTNLKLDEGASIYYMGSVIGERDIPVNLVFDTEITPKNLIISSIKYNKFINSQNRQRHSENQLQTTGIIKLQDKNIYFNDFKIKTLYPVDIKLFNILFRKPIIKTGQFTSNIILNGEMAHPNVNGEINVTGANIPFFDTSINNMSLNFKPKTIDIEIDGNLINNKFKLNADAKNSLKPPFILEKASLKTGNFNVDNILNSIRKNEIENTNSIKFYPVKFNHFIVKNLNINADSVQFNTLKAKNLNADVALFKGDINVKYFKFILAHGQMNGSALYRYATKKSNFNINVTNADANTLMTSLFDLSGQLYGSLNGNMEFTCINTNKHNCLKTLAGNAKFNVKDGRMPKLGSIEYLLKAGNLLKSGVTGLSINGIIDLITPLKTGNFDSISGLISVNNGVTDKLQILSSGKDLSLFMTGEYNFSNYNANMYIFGRLSKKISTMLGPIGNASLNTLFNTIPGVNLNKIEDKSLLNEINKLPILELSDKLYRVFTVKIHGDITGENFVDSFRWIE